MTKTMLMGGKQPGHRFEEGFAYRDYEQATAKMLTKREKFMGNMY